MRKSRLTLSLPAIAGLFDSRGPAVYRRSDLLNVLRTNRETWKLPASVGASKFLDFLLENINLTQVTLPSPYAEIVRYVYGEASAFLVALSIDNNAYLSHGTAAHLHGLVSEQGSRIYINKEQSEKPSYPSTLVQESIDLAFARQQRLSQNVFSYRQYGLVVLNGKNTRQLEVRPILGPNGETLRATDLERTLIDLAVRPAYAGGVQQVLYAYKQARPKVSLENLSRILKLLGYRYPYHQTIGFYLARAGFEDSALRSFQNLGTKLNFYLDYGLEDPAFDARWCVYYPKNLM